MKKVLSVALMVFSIITASFSQNVSSGTGAIGSVDSWQVGTSVSSVTGSTYVIPTNFSVWEPAPIAGTNAKWISVTPGGIGAGMTDFFYEKALSTVPASGVKELKCNFRVAADDVLKKIELVNGSTVINVPFVLAAAPYRLTNLINETIKCPKSGNWKLRVTVFCADAKGYQGPTALLVTGSVDQVQGECCDCNKPTNANINLSFTTKLGGGTTATASAIGASASLGNGWTLKEVTCGMSKECKWVPGAIKWQSVGATINIPAGVLLPGKCYVLTHYVNVCSPKWDPNLCWVSKAICFTICENNISVQPDKPQNLQKRAQDLMVDEEMQEMQNELLKITFPPNALKNQQ